MISITPQQATARLERADGVTAQLKNSESLREMATASSDALHYELSHPPRTVKAENIPVQRPFSPTAFSAAPPNESYSLVLIGGGLPKGPVELENLIAELIAAYISLQAAKGKKSADSRPTFPYIVSALSTLAPQYGSNHYLARVCQAAQREAIVLAAAAVMTARSDILHEMSRGIAAVLDTKSPPTVFSWHVAEALKAYRNLKDRKGTEPFKSEVRDEAIEGLKSRGLRPYPSDQDWKSVYKIANLTHLKQIRGTKGKSRNGGS